MTTLQELFEKCEKRLGSQARRQGCELRFHYPDSGLPAVTVNEDSWRNVLVTLCQQLLQSPAHQHQLQVLLADEQTLQLSASLAEKIDLSERLQGAIRDLQGSSQLHDQQIAIFLPLPALAAKTIAGHILLADDHQDNLLFIEKLLQQMGFDVTTASNGYEAVETAMVNDFDLIFLDIQMPVMDGLEALELIHATGSNCPIVALTANVQPHEVAEYLSAGFDACLSKPLDRTEFAQLVKRLSGQQQSDAFESLYQSEEYQDMVRGFKRGLRRYEQELIEAHQQKDRARLARLSHALKGAGGNFGFQDITHAAAALEQQAKSSEAIESRDFHHLVDLIRLNCD